MSSGALVPSNIEGRLWPRTRVDEGGLPTCCQGVILEPFHVVASVRIAGATGAVVGDDDRRVS
jgi:hypothetical protein